MRFRPEQHLRRPGDIRRVREQGSRLDARSFTLWWRPRGAGEAGGTGARVGIAASAAAVGGAVQRNRAKRRLREVFRRQQALAPAGCDLLIVARADVLRRSFPELEARLAEACRRVGASRLAP
jgi:ribonuclease P protein component